MPQAHKEACHKSVPPEAYGLYKIKNKSAQNAKNHQPNRIGNYLQIRLYQGGKNCQRPE
jgi:hypothetical protein